MRKIKKHFNLIIIFIAVLSLVFFFNAAKISAATFSVNNDPSAGCDDLGTGGPKPFCTIQKCATKAQPGDTCLVSEGTYRETVIPVNDAVTFKADNNNVVVSGAEVLNNWQVHQGNIYKTDMSWDLGLGKNQLFANGEMVGVARWPDGILNLLDPLTSTVDSAGVWTDNTLSNYSVGTIIDSSLPNINLTGALVMISSGEEWTVNTGTITSQSTGSITLKTHNIVKLSTSWAKLTAGNRYFLFDSLSLLNNPGEWFFDRSLKKVYLWTADSANPGTKIIEAKKRELAFDLSGRKNIIIDGFRIFAASIKADPLTQNSTIRNINAKYVSHYSIVDQGSFVKGTLDTGILLRGTNNILENCEIAYSAGNGVLLGGSGNTIQNCKIHEADYALGSPGAILNEQLSSGNKILNNTLYNTSGSILRHDETQNLKILHNHIYNGGFFLKDLGLTYAYSTDGAGTEIAYNLVHDNFARKYPHGIYLDNYDSNFNVHHNIVYNVDVSLCLNDNSNTNVYNNTFYANNYGITGNADTSTNIQNNIFNRPSLYYFTGTYKISNNILGNSDPLFVDAPNRNFQLKPGSAAIDTATDLGFTEDFMGNKVPYGLRPDKGAIEFTGSSPADVNSDTFVNSQDITLCVNVILGMETTPAIVARAKAVVPDLPENMCNVLDLQAIVNEILK